jgi:hypothetical protein
MAIVYMDLDFGSDSSGDGSWSAPYKTLGKATLGLTGGDEVRVALNGQEQLSGTLTFTNKSATVNTSVDLRTEVQAYDVIRHPATNEAWWSVSSVTIDTIVLSKPYYGTDGSGKTVFRMRPTVPDAYQYIKSTGVSEANRLKISGGWNLSTQTKIGLTAWRYRGILYTDQDNGNSYNAFIEISDFCSQKFDLYEAHGCYIHDIYCFISEIDLGSRNILENAWFGSGAEIYFEGHNPSAWEANLTKRGQGHCCVKNVWIYSGYVEIYSAFNFVENLNVLYPQYGYALYINNCCNSYFKDCVFDGNEDPDEALIYFEWANSKNVFHNCTFKNSLGCAIEDYDSYPDYIAAFIDCTFENIAVGIFSLTYNPDDSYRLGSKPMYVVHNTEGDSYRWFKEGGKITSTETGSRSGKCLKFSPVISFFDLEEPVGAYKISSTDSPIDLNVYMKKDGDFDGEVWLMVVRGGCNLGLTPITLTTDYAQKTVTIATPDLVIDEYLTMWVVVQGSSGNVFADDFSME